VPAGDGLETAPMDDAMTWFIRYRRFWTERSTAWPPF
jgi:hypothetical protein